MTSANRELHVLVIPSWYPSSVDEVRGSFFREQALALSRHGCRTGVIYPQLPLLKQWRAAFTTPYGLAEENDNGIRTLRWCSFLPTANGTRFVKLGLRLYGEYVTRYGSPDLIHAHSIFYGGILAHEVKKRFNIPFVITEHSTGFARGRIRPTQRQVGIEVVGSASRRLAVSAPFCDLLQSFFGNGASRWMPLPNIVSKRFTSAKLAADKERPFIFLCVAQLVSSKAIDNLVSAFAEAFSEDPTVTLRIGGSGPERKKLLALAEHLGVNKQIEFLGQLSREQVVTELTHTTAFALPSRHETFGVVVVEALAMGKPVVATCSGGPESIVRLQDGKLVPPDDVPALARALRHIYENMDQYDPQAIRQACIDRFGEEVVTDKLKQIYRSVLEREDRA